MGQKPDSAQIRAARGLLNWSQDDLAKRADVGICTVRRLEREGPQRMRGTIVTGILQTLNSAGVLFIPRGVKLRAQTEIAQSSTGENL